MQIKPKVDTATRKWLMTADSFRHPAKMNIPMLLWIVQRYTKVDDVILDPMAGAGTTMLACWMGRNVVLVELEQKFVDMCKANWEKLRQMPSALGFEMAWCEIRQGDARNLPDVLVDCAIFSPPYAEAQSGGGIAKEGYTKPYQKDKIDGGNIDPVGKRTYMPENVGDNEANISLLPYGSIDAAIFSPPYSELEKRDRSKEASWASESEYLRGDKNISQGYSESVDNIGNLPHGDIDAIITSPPYEASVSDNKESPLAGGNEAKYGRWKKGTARKISYTQDEPVDAIITSPPYEEAMGEKHHSPAHERISKDKHWDTTYTERGAECNLGNLKGDTYLQAMQQVYAQCHKVLKPNGLMILVTKNFIRNKQIVPLDEHTIKLCESVGFILKERHYRKLTSQSFWRVIYQQKYPDAPVIEKEDILVFRSVDDNQG